VERPQVLRVVAGGKDTGAQIGQRGERQPRPDLSQPLPVDDAEPVTQHTTAHTHRRTVALAEPLEDAGQLLASLPHGQGTAQNAIFPDAWEDFLAPIPTDEHDDLLRAYYSRLTSDDPAIRQAAAKAWSIWEGKTSSLYPNPEIIERSAGDEYSLARSRIECHYFVNGAFFDHDGQLLTDIGRIRHIPTVIVQGRYDIVCPADSAWALHRAFPEADLRIVPGAGHTASDPGNLHELVEATDRFREH
jgi:proline iminopeptidase